MSKTTDTTTALHSVEICTDGACRGNPGPGGWGALLNCRGRDKSLYGAEFNTTNNRMELMAAICALESLKRPCQVTLYTDSSYVCNGIREWLPRWKRQGWRTGKRDPVKNRDLWERLEMAANRHEMRWEWVKGHSGHLGNERADMLANLAIDELLKEQA
ncbi:MAG: ribonuclease HI [Candidatus Eutrophobiaceae bacterium]